MHQSQDSDIFVNGKEPVTHKTVTETKLIFETEISLQEIGWEDCHQTDV